MTVYALNYCQTTVRTIRYWSERYRSSIQTHVRLRWHVDSVVIVSMCSLVEESKAWVRHISRSSGPLADRHQGQRRAGMTKLPTAIDFVDQNCRSALSSPSFSRVYATSAVYVRCPRDLPACQLCTLSCYACTDVARVHPPEHGYKA